MATFKVRKRLVYTYEAEIEAEDWEEAEEKARYNDNVEWEDVTDYNYPNDDFDTEEV